MIDHDAIRQTIEVEGRRVREELQQYVTQGGRLAVIKAPPGSGKTSLLLEIVSAVARAGPARIAIACQTNTQANDICRRFALYYNDVPVVRFAARSATIEASGPSITWENVTAHLPHGPSVVVATTAKWGLVPLPEPYDVLFVDEAWQMAWKDFMLLGQVAGRFVLIGDPGQIPPVVTIDSRRWETAPRPPHMPAPEVVLASPDLNPFVRSLPATRRLPYDSAKLVQCFYDFEFGSYAGPRERAVLTTRGSADGLDRAIALLAESTAVGVTIPTPDGGPPMEKDEELARSAVAVALRLLEREGSWRMDGKERRLNPEDIGITATHRVMNSAVDLALPPDLRGRIGVDTPERWQGLERPVMIALHPLSGILRPSAFDLETGRMCVMLSRHQGGLVVVARDHIGETLDKFIPTATQAVGRPDVTGRGHTVHMALWWQLADAGRILGL